MDKLIVAVDLDDTIHEYSHTLALVALNEFGVRIDTEPLEWKDVLLPITDYSLGTKIFQKCHDREYIFLTNPYPGAVEGLREIESMGYEVQYFTDRKIASYDDTLDWLLHHGFPNPTGLHCCRDKRRDLIKIKDRVATVIDDRPRTIQFAQMELGCKNVFSIKHSTNANLSDMVGVNLVDSWFDLTELFKEVMVNAV